MKPTIAARVGNVVTAAGNTVSGTTGALVGFPPQDTIAYIPPPADVLAAADGTPAAPFAGFPLTTVP